jgi:pimeloyl-ACP methyl ester carboxylesterase
MLPPYFSYFPQKLGAAKESIREQAQLSALIFSSGRVPISAVTPQRTCLVQGRTISYCEAGDVSASAILLLHGLPGGSTKYDTLIRALADKFHLIAPDYIGFGASEALEPGVFAYTFENLTDYVAGLIEAIGLERYVLDMHDCGGPVGFRLFARAPARVTGFIIQNANAYVEGASTACFRAFAPLGVPAALYLAKALRRIGQGVRVVQSGRSRFEAQQGRRPTARALIACMMIVARLAP